jgi:tRNA(adenine34) deaminase
MQAELAISSAPSAADSVFMQEALAAARQAASLGEVPIGAVLVRGNSLLAVGHNAPIVRSDPTAHAEVLALREAALQVGNYRLPGTTMYVTAEPCAMCVGALMHARVARVVYGCADPKAGALGSVYDLSLRWTNHRFEITSGVCAAEARALLQDFFRARRGA